MAREPAPSESDLACTTFVQTQTLPQSQTHHTSDRAMAFNIRLIRPHNTPPTKGNP